MNILKLLVGKLSSAIIICFTILLLVFFGSYLVKPESTTEFLNTLPSWLGGVVDAFEVEGEEATEFNVGSFFENLKIPSYSFAVEGCPTPVISINLVVIILFFIATIVSFFVAPVSLITTIVANVIAWIASIRLIGAYQYVVAEGVSTWDAAGYCFWPMVVMIMILLFSACDEWVDVIAGLDNQKFVSEYFLYSAIFAAAAFVVSLIFSGLSWLAMGLGWGGMLYVLLVIVGIVGAILEMLLLFKRTHR